MLYHSENQTTTTVKGSVATVIADSIKNGKRITTFELVYPRFIHSELMTYRMFSRNASSSRATPLSVTLNEVRNDPVFFDKVGKNQPGMVAGALLTEQELSDFQCDWWNLAQSVADQIEKMAENYNIHKQVLNRALEPFTRIRTLVTATEYTNFFQQRLAPDAQPEIYSLALAMKTAMDLSKPVERDAHIPYINDCEQFNSADDKIKASVARCARVSYGRHDQKLSTIEDDLKLYNHLVKNHHLSPLEHIASAVDFNHSNKRYDNFTGWRSLRNQLADFTKTGQLITV